MLQGVGARFDFHMCKSLCDLRWDGKGNLWSLLIFLSKGWRNFRYHSRLSGFEGGLARSQGGFPFCNVQVPE